MYCLALHSTTLHPMQYFSEFGEFGKQMRVVFCEAAEVGTGQRDALEEIGFTLVEATVAVGTKGLQYAHKEIAPKIVEPLLAGSAFDVSDVEVVVEQLGTYWLGEVAFGAVEQRGHIVLCGTAPATLIVDIVESG